MAAAIVRVPPRNTLLGVSCFELHNQTMPYSPELSSESLLLSMSLLPPRPPLLASAYPSPNTMIGRSGIHNVGHDTTESDSTAATSSIAY